MNRKVAQNAALPNVSKFYDRAMESGWEIHHAEIASVENLKNWRDKEKDYNSPIGYTEK